MKNSCIYYRFILLLLIFMCITPAKALKHHSNQKYISNNNERLRIIVTSDGEIDDECSMVRFLLYANEWDIEGIVTTSSQYHWHNHDWAGDNWMEPYLNAYEQVYPNLIKHDKNYPTPEYLRKITVLGNVTALNDMSVPTSGSDLIVKVLLDETDPRPIWLQAWGGTNTIARALKTIEEKHPDKMQRVADKLRFFFIWEQDDTYQSYIRPHWGKYNILTIISDQFDCMAYNWKTHLPKDVHKHLEGSWMRKNILSSHGPLCNKYKSHSNGDFRSEGDSPAYFHVIPTGLRGEEHPDWGGWGGRYVKVRDNTWLDPVPVKGFKYPEGKWYDRSGWTRSGMLATTKPTDNQRYEYYQPIWRWLPTLQNDFAARADWCVNSYEDANHAPIVKLSHSENITVSPGKKVKLYAKGTYDPDGDELTYRWWQYTQAGTYSDSVDIVAPTSKKASLVVPKNTQSGETIHIICEVTDNGTPTLTRYRRVVITVK